MKSVLFAAALLSSVVASASPLEDVISAKEQKTFNEMTYKGLPVSGKPGDLCKFLGYDTAINAGYNTDYKGKFYQLFQPQSGEFEILIGHQSDLGVTTVFQLTCAREPKPAPPIQP